MACLLFGAMPSSKPILSYCQLDPYEQTSMNFNQNATFFINENAYENIVCEMAAILSRGETSQHTYQAILQPTMTRSVSSVNYAHGLPYPSWLRHWQWISDTIVPVPVKQPIKHEKALQWRHDGRDSVSNHQPHDCFLNRLFRHRSKKTSKLRVTGLCAGNSPEADEFPAQMASNAENVSIWWRHHVVPWIRIWAATIAKTKQCS